MTMRQQRFCDEYITCGNATEAAARAGYSERCAKQTGQRLLTFDAIRAYIDAQIERIRSEKIADAREVLEYMSSVMRGESTAAVLAGQEIIRKGPDESQRLKAAELLGKRYGLFADRVDLGAVPIVFVGGEDVAD